MNQEKIQAENTLEQIPLKERNTFQILLMQEMIGENASDEAMVKWSQKYGERVSHIIDDTQNENLQALIMKHEYEAAVQEILELLK